MTPQELETARQLIIESSGAAHVEESTDLIVRWPKGDDRSFTLSIIDRGPGDPERWYALASLDDGSIVRGTPAGDLAVALGSLDWVEIRSD